MKVSYLDTIIESICLHKVGNKIADEGVKLSKKHLIVRKHSDKYIFYTLRFDCSFAAANTIKPQLL